MLQLHKLLRFGKKALVTRSAVHLLTYDGIYSATFELLEPPLSSYVDHPAFPSICPVINQQYKPQKNLTSN